MILRFFYKSHGNSSDIVLSDKKLFSDDDYDWKLTIGVRSSDILDFITNSNIFSKKRRISGHPNPNGNMLLRYKITDEELAMLLLQYS